NLVALLELQGFHHGEGKADGEAVAPFRNPHQALLKERRSDQHYPARRSSASEWPTSALARAKRIDDPQSAVDRHPILHVLGPQLVALGEKGGGGYESVVDAKLIAFGQSESKLMSVDRDRMHGQELAQRGQKASRFPPRPKHFPSSDICDFVQNLNADRPAFANDGFRAIRLCSVLRREVDEDIRVKETTGHLLHRGRT